MKKLILFSLTSVALAAQCPTLPALATMSSNGLARKPPMGWNSWYTYMGLPTDAAVRANADAMVASGMAAVGYQYVSVDDGWEAQYPARDGGGNLMPNNRFPNMAAMAAYIHSKGLKAGIYNSPGTSTCGSNNAGSMNHELQDAAQFAAWGFDLLKYDWCGAGPAYTAASCPFTPQQIWQLMAQSIRATGRDMLYAISDYGVSASIAKAAGANQVRTGQDSAAQDFSNWINMVFHNNNSATGYGPGFWNDGDFLPVGLGLFTTDESKLAMSLFAIRAAPLFASNDLTAMTATTRDILINTDVIAVDQDALGLQGVPVSVVGSGEVWAKRLSDGWAVGLFNLSASPLSVASTWSMFGQAGSFQARDLWTHANLGSLTGYAPVVPSHGVVMLKLTTSSTPPSSLVSGKAKIGGGQIQ